jgi:hypothetical protein
MENAPPTFRITLWRPWLLALVMLAIPAGVVVVLTIIAGQPAAIVAILLGFVGIALLLLLLIGLTAGTSRWHVDPAGIGGRNNYLVYHRLNWTDIESVEPWLIPGYRYVQVNGVSKRRAFWLPLFLNDMPSFRIAVARYAPPGNPLRRFLEEHPS